MFFAIPGGYVSSDGRFRICSLDDRWNSWCVAGKCRLVGRFDDPNTAARACLAFDEIRRAA